ncbi:AGAP008443-PA-like protein [Anopheles sinensis]|uniref:AGAP008443-PA-like protein n=1 Tax=Anopheles sinensis TaxID=74873 RepID=A0A084W1X4_ANOSI|nr:AGAP008443-PA-like protein [Anopheles sinensis]
MPAISAMCQNVNTRTGCHGCGARQEVGAGREIERIAFVFPLPFFLDNTHEIQSGNGGLVPLLKRSVCAIVRQRTELTLPGFGRPSGQVFPVLPIIRPSDYKPQQLSCATATHLATLDRLITVSERTTDRPVPQKELWFSSGVNLPRVTAQLEKLMGTNVVRLTDRKYMQELQRRIQEDYNVTLEKRISERELKSTCQRTPDDVSCSYSDANVGTEQI